MTARPTHLVFVPGLACTEDLFAEHTASLRGEVAIKSNNAAACPLMLQERRQPTNSFERERLGADHERQCSHRKC